eukprot:scaffold144821_cov36-Tisochrysis_lutea.AAC.2
MVERPRHALTQEDMAADRAVARWEAVRTFTNAPCLRPSLATGAAGGLAIFTLRYLTAAGPVAAATWGATVFGLLCGSNWMVCRRAMYAKLAEEAKLLHSQDPHALRNHAERVKARQALQ